MRYSLLKSVNLLKAVAIFSPVGEAQRYTLFPTEIVIPNPTSAVSRLKNYFKGWELDR
jgi:hypothetical protein